MVESMTGFGRGMASGDGYSITVEMKAVNHRFLEIYTRLPKQLLSREEALKKQLQNEFSRGKIDVFVSFESAGAKKAVVKVDKELAMAYHNALAALGESLNLPSQLSLQELASMNGVLSLEAPQDDEEAIAALLTAAVAQAAEQLLLMRRQEGAALAADLLARLAFVEERAGLIAACAPQVVREQKARLEQRLAELLGATPIDENRLANELAFFADKVDISEELTRLSSHLAQFRQTLAGSGPIGRKLDFIQQEMLREANTVGSKAQALAINRTVIEVKSELEKIREQIQNIE